LGAEALKGVLVLYPNELVERYHHVEGGLAFEFA
jgi:hypothetical protein